jgi:hypothetical protein
MALWPNNYSTAQGWLRSRLFGRPDFSCYTQGQDGARRNIFVSDKIPKTSSVPNGYAPFGTPILPIRAGGMGGGAPISFNAAAALIAGGPMEGATTFGIVGNGADLSLQVTLSGDGTLSITTTDPTLVLTLSLSADGAFSLSGNSSSLSLIVPMEGAAEFSLTGAADLRGLASLAGDWSANAGQLTAESIAQAVWAAVAASNNVTGSMGEKLNDAGSASNPWTEVIEAGYTATDIFRILMAVLSGRTQITELGGGAALVEFLSVLGNKVRVSAQMQGSERTDVTLDPS